VADVIFEGEVRTYDMLRLPGNAGVFGKGAATTTEMADAILARIAVPVQSR
jgi:3-isopropylmalate dehydrogenase